MDGGDDAGGSGGGRLRELLLDLVGTYSPSGKEEEVVTLLDDYLRSRGLPVTTVGVDETRRDLVVWPTERQPEMMLLGHVDTVPAYDLESYEPVEDDGIVRGLGTADMKGGCAAMVDAFVDAWGEYGHAGAVALALVVGEEETGDGTQALLEHYRCPWALVGEPTGLHPCLGHYGYLEVEVTTRGERRHASLADHGHQAVDVMLHTLLELTEELERRRDRLVFNIRDVHSSEAGFAVPDACTSYLDVHVEPSLSLEEIADGLTRLVDPTSPGMVAVSFPTRQEGYVLEQHEPFVDQLREACSHCGVEWRTEHFRSHSDANVLWAAGVKPVILGPGRLSEAHTDHESVSFNEVADAAGVYRRLIENLSSRTPQPT